MDQEQPRDLLPTRWVQHALLASRWILLVFFAVLVLALAAFAVVFVVHVVEQAPHLASMDEADLILSLLNLVDATLVASLVVMVILSGYANFVAPMEGGEGLPWLRSLDAGGLKVKIATSIVAISSIELLEMFFNIDRQSSGTITAAVVLQVTFIATALALGLLERLNRH